MTSLFKSDPAPPVENPSVAVERERLQKTAEEDRRRSLQEQLRGVGSRNNDLFGIRSLLGPLGGGGKRSLLGVG